jgi:hypothetical protein
MWPFYTDAIAFGLALRLYLIAQVSYICAA